MKQYLSDRLSDRISLVQHQARKELVGAVPNEVDVAAEGGEDNLLERIQQQGSADISRFHPAFWAAFRKPIENHKRRYVTNTEPIEFRDVSVQDQGFGVEIDREYVDPAADPSQVRQKIQEWFGKHDVESDIYLMAHQERPTESRDLLDLVLDSLEISELQRVTLPLDVVLKLRRRVP